MIRDARESDLETIVRIYNAAIPGRLATADTEPVSTQSKLTWFRDRDVARYPLWVLERNDHVCAWLDGAQRDLLILGRRLESGRRD
jgi:phosphinothricin acetyltransferase